MSPIPLRVPMQVDGYSVANLTGLFMNGMPSNDPEEAGLTVHCFDGMEDFEVYLGSQPGT